jgi:hypothetical protein
MVSIVFDRLQGVFLACVFVFSNREMLKSEWGKVSKYMQWALGGRKVFIDDQKDLDFYHVSIRERGPDAEANTSNNGLDANANRETTRARFLSSVQLESLSFGSFFSRGSRKESRSRDDKNNTKTNTIETFSASAIPKTHSRSHLKGIGKKSQSTPTSFRSSLRPITEKASNAQTGDRVKSQLRSSNRYISHGDDIYSNERKYDDRESLGGVHEFCDDFDHSDKVLHCDYAALFQKLSQEPYEIGIPYDMTGAADRVSESKNENSRTPQAVHLYDDDRDGLQDAESSSEKNDDVKDSYHKDDDDDDDDDDSTTRQGHQKLPDV